MVLPPRLDPGCLMLPCLAKSQLWPQFNFFSASPREPDKSEFGTNPGRQKRGRKSNLMKQRRFFWYKWYKNWFKCIFKNQIRLSTVDNFRAKTSLFPTYQDLAGNEVVTVTKSAATRAPLVASALTMFLFFSWSLWVDASFMCQLWAA